MSEPDAVAELEHQLDAALELLMSDGLREAFRAAITAPSHWQLAQQQPTLFLAGHGVAAPEGLSLEWTPDRPTFRPGIDSFVVCLVVHWHFWHDDERRPIEAEFRLHVRPAQHRKKSNAGL
jgi:hypothetical protein